MSSTLSPITLTGVVLVGGMYETRDHHRALENAELNTLLGAAPGAPDAILNFAEADVTLVDGDTHHWKSPATPDEIEAILAAAEPTPEAAWRTHGNGVRLLYSGPNHKARAIAAAFSLPTTFNVEIKRDTCHPKSSRRDKPGASCGPIHFYSTDPRAQFKFSTVATPSAEDVSSILEKHGLAVGERYGHEKCLIDASASDSNNCVRVLHKGVYCFSCAANGRKYPGMATAGYVPFSVLAGYGESILERLSVNRVHWTHAAYELKHARPNLSDDVLRLAYTLALIATYGSDDLRIRNVFNKDLDFVWGKGMWLEASEFKQTCVDTDAAKGLPYVQYVIEKEGKNEEGEKTKWFEIRIDTVRRSQVKNRMPNGYTPIQPVHGYVFRGFDGVVPVKVPTDDYPYELLEQPLSEEAAWRELEASFPRLDRRYLKACLAAAICADAGPGGQPPMLACKGPSGSAKGETIRLAASFLGNVVKKVQPSENFETVMRDIGAALAEGQRFLVLDELNKVPQLSKKLGAILQIGSQITWRPLYQSHSIVTECRAAFFMPCVTFPQFLSTSSEFCRRTHYVRLGYVVPNWGRTSGGDTAAWRNRTPRNAIVANSLVTHVWRKCREFKFQF